MSRRRASNAPIAMAAIVLLVLVGRSLLAGELEEDNAAGRVPYPIIPRGQGEKCVEDTDFMRRNHMILLMQQRDDTMLKGIRNGRFGLKECVACHAVAGPDGMPVTVTSSKHFCRSCHDYAAVNIDCFQCHASRPDVEPANDDHGETVARAERE